MAQNLLLGKVSPVAGTVTLLTNTPDSADYASVTISCVNTGAVNILVSIYVSSNSVPVDLDIIENKVLIEPSGVLERSCVIVDSLENIFVLSDGPGAVFRVYGIEKTIQLDPASSASLNNLTNITLPNLQTQVQMLSTKINAVVMAPQNVMNGYLNLSLSNYFYTTIGVNTTFSLAVVPPSGTFVQFFLEITYSGSAYITWWSGLRWPSGISPVTSLSGKDLFRFYTIDGGATTLGEVVGLGY